MRINNNIMAFNAQRNLGASAMSMGKSIEKLSSGLRINRAADDASGLVISQKLRAQTSGLRQAARNAQDGISVVQTAEGALNEVHSMLNRMRDLAVQASNTGSNDATARGAAQQEFAQLRTEIDRIGTTTSFGDVKLLNGSYGVTAANAVGYDADNSVVIGAGNDTFTLDINGDGAVTVTLDQATYTGDQLATEVESKIRSALLAGTAAQVAHADNISVTSERAGAGATLKLEVSGLADTETFVLAENGADTFLANTNFGAATAASGSGGVFQVGANNTADDQISVSIVSVSAADLSLAALDLSTDAGAAIDAIDLAIASVSASRGDLGAVQNRFESTIANLQVTSENLSASESRIRDTDVAAEMVEFTRAQILQQAGTAMLGQANAVPQSVLRLLG
ncbi:MAG: flagellin [Acidimicrobiales bacterium]